MISVIDLSYHEGSLGMDEFALPVARISRNAGYPARVIHWSALPDTPTSPDDRVILCGTAMKDNGYLNDLSQFEALLHAGVPVLGICAGMQALVLAAGGRLGHCLEIGVRDVRVIAPDPIFKGRTEFPAYCLHQHGVSLPPGFLPLARSHECLQAVCSQDRRVYGVMFHPEVRNEWVIERFLDAAGRMEGEARL